MSNHEFIDISGCEHPFLTKDKRCLVCGQVLENYNPKKYRKFRDVTIGGHNH